MQLVFLTPVYELNSNIMPFFYIPINFIHLGTYVFVNTAQGIVCKSTNAAQVTDIEKLPNSHPLAFNVVTEFNVFR